MPAYLITVISRSNDAAPQQLYLIDGDLSAEAITHISAELLHDPVVHSVNWQDLITLASTPSRHATAALEVAFRPGVTDNEAESVRLGIEHLGLSNVRMVKTLRRYQGDLIDKRQVCNDLIQVAFIDDQSSPERRARWYAELLRMPEQSVAHVTQVPIMNASDEELLHISRTGVLALDLEEMKIIQAYFRHEEREPSDGELETLAQTWSEHCSHKTFKAKVLYRSSESDDRHDLESQHYPALNLLQKASHEALEIDSLIKTFLMRATTDVLAQQSAGSHPQLEVLSAFVDNAGIIAFTDDYELSIKVETHNHPSALEPFGGANTGVGGVVRDVLGVSAQPIANTDVLCFGPLDTADESLSDGVLPPRHVAAGVVAGVRDYGNKLGIPTINGAVLYNPGYTANPLVYCGTIGLAPRGRHPRHLQPGDHIVVLGGRTGRDGIHGATFSSVELTHTTAEQVGSAVQIGDPITEKKMIDVVLQARDAGLYTAITDCGAGGLSSAVGEMGESTGARVFLEHVPLKYVGLQPWEIWLSEAQERMVIAVPPQHLTALLKLCAAEDVEATDIGYFSGDGRLLVSYDDLTVVDLDMTFLHGGRPQRRLEALWTIAPLPEPSSEDTSDATDLLGSLLALLAHPNIASKADIIRSYDHEVQGRTVIKPLVGVYSDGPGDAAVLQPLRNSIRGAAIGAGINPLYGQVDAYWMALACIDEALRNIVAVGADPAQTVILDNFCWGDPRRPDRMASLVRATAGCYDAALAFGTPFVSGKDSLNNEYLAADGTRTPIPPTLLISALAIVPDIRQCVTMDLKQAGNLVYIVGLTKPELKGSHYAALSTESVMQTLNQAMPQVDLATAPAIMRALHHAIRSGCVQSCHDLSEGGLAVAAAEMAIAGRMGLQLHLAAVPKAAFTPEHDSSATLLFSESTTRFLVEVAPEKAQAFEQALAGMPYASIGEVVDLPIFRIQDSHGTEIIQTDITSLRVAWQSNAHKSRT